MESEIIVNMKILKTYKYKITKQQYKTFKGQILNGCFEEFHKGLFKVLKGIGH